MLTLTKQFLVNMCLFFIAISMIISGVSLATTHSSIKIEYLYINKILVTHDMKELSFFRELLPGGKISISGKINRDIEIKEVEISIDGKKTWKKVKLSKDNNFSYSFRTKETNGRYDLYIRITDKDGNINDVDATYKTISIEKKTLYNTVKETLDRLIDAYQMRSTAKFMSYVDDSYTGEKTILEKSIMNDFNAIHDVSISYVLNSVVPDYKDKVVVSLNFTRSYTEIKTGQRKVDEGVATLIFKIDKNMVKLYSMRGSAIFGFK